MKCRVCNTIITPFMSFGKMPIANGFLKKNQITKEYFYNLETCFCKFCKTFQIKKQPNPKKMFHGNYPFFSSLSKGMTKHFQLLSSKIKKKYIKNINLFVIELGCNDGIFLKNFKEYKHLGIEPSKNVAKEAAKNGISVLSNFFSFKLSKEIKEKYGNADLIYSANVMCHIPNINDVAKGISNLLNDNGVLIFEDPYLGDVIEKTSFDQIYDEHVFLFSAHSVKNIFSKYNLNLFKTEYLNTHGGSMRYYLKKESVLKNYKQIQNILKIEQKNKLHLMSTYLKFKKNCENFKEKFRKFLLQMQKNNINIIGYGATSKSTTILNYCKIDKNLISEIFDITKLKQNKLSPGTHIPVNNFNYDVNTVKDYYILFAWNHKKEILHKESQNKKFKGKWYIPFPYKK
jgi:methylation protein EvaC